MTSPRFLVFGAGATGSVFAARLASRYEVAVVARGARLRHLRRDGLRIVGATEAEVRLPAASSPTEWDGFAPDFVLVTVKATDTAAATAALAPLGPTPVRVSLQNGLGNEETLAEGGNPVLGAVSNNGATLRDTGEVFHAGLGEVILGPFTPETPTAATTELVNHLRAVGFPARSTADIRKALWDKVILNAAVNPVTALLGLRTGRLHDDPGRRRIVARLVEEAGAVAAAEGVRCSPEEVHETIRRVAAATPENRSSMLQDLERGRRTEIEAINGVIAARGRTHGVPTPWNDLMLRLVREREPPPGAPQPDAEPGRRDPVRK